MEVAILLCKKVLDNLASTEYDPNMTPYQIKRLRLEEEFTITQAAAKLGVSTYTWTRWEKGTNVPLNAHTTLLERWARRVANRRAKEASDD